MMTVKQCFHTGLLLAAATLSARAGTFSSDFNSGTVPANTAVFGNSVAESAGGVGDSGCLKLTKNIGSQSGGFVLNDLDNGQPIYGFDISFDLLLSSSGTPADGFSLCYGPDLPDGTWGEEGVGSGLRFCFDTYDNGNETPQAPSIDVAMGGTKLATNKRTIATLTSNAFVKVHIRLNPDGALNFDFRGQTIFTNLYLAAYQDFVNLGQAGRFGFGGRTGGSSENAFIDNLQITTFTTPQVGLSRQPASLTVLPGNDAVFDVRVGNVNGVTYQWYSNNVAIADASTQTLIIPNVQASYSGSKYKVVVSGPNNTVTSSEATLTVSNLTLPATPQLSFNFDNGSVPANAAVFGTAFVDMLGGVGDSGVLKLTQAVNDQSGAFVISDPNAGAAVYGFTARFKARVGGGTMPPADGFAFAFGNDIPADPTANRPEYEQGGGLGTNLLVTFDIFNNDSIIGISNPADQQPAPSIDVRYQGKVVATRQLPLDFMETGDQYGDTIIQMNTDGTLNVVYRGVVIFDRLVVPGFGSIAGGSFALAGRTGGLSENLWFDNIQITSDLSSGAPRITVQPVSQTVLVNHTVTFSVGLNDTTGVTYQWLRGGAPISGATTSSYSIAAAALTDNAASFTAQVTKGAASVTSSAAALTVVDLAPPTSPTLSFNFNDGLVPANTAVYGNAYVTANQGVGDSGVLHLTDAVNSQGSAFVMKPVFGGALVSTITAAFDVRLGGGSGTPADGFSFNWAADLPDSLAPSDAERGVGTGFSVAFRIFLGGGDSDNPPSPYVGIKYKGSLVASTQIPYAQLDTGTDFRKVLVRVDPDGKVYLSYGERVLYNGLQLPNFTFLAGKFGIYGRTGGENDNQWFDNIQIQATQSTGPMTIAQQPADVMVLAGQTATFTVVPSNPNGATYQWYRNNTAISGATSSSYTTAATTTADNGAVFKATVTGPSGSATSSTALLTVVAPISIGTPTVTYNFDDWITPVDTILNGTGEGSGNGGYIGLGGVNDTGCLHIADAINGEHGTFIIPDLNTNAPVKAFTMYFAALVGGGSTPPADGFSMSWTSSNEVPATTVVGEEGIGSGLIVSVHLYNGGNPYFAVDYHGARVATKYAPLSTIETGNTFGDAFIRVNANGTLDMQYRGKIIFDQLVLPGYTIGVGNVFVLAGRTGGLNENIWFDDIKIATTTGLIQVPISYGMSGSNLRLTWSGSGFKLQSTGSLTPPITWTDAPNATSPFTTPTTGAPQYFRLAPAQ